MTFKELLELEYPLPFLASIWGRQELTNLDSLVELVVKDLQSDVEIYDSKVATGLHTILPEGTRAVSSVRLQVPFQGNTYVKYSYDSTIRTVHCRFIPAVIKYKRNLKVEDLDVIGGSKLQYCKIYALIKMLEKEISYISSIKLNSDIGDIDIQALRDKKAEFQKTFDEMKLDIMLYSHY